MQSKKLPLAVAASLLASVPIAHANDELTAELAPVVVSATRFAAPSDTTPAGVTVITADEIKASGAKSASEAIQQIAGVAGHLDTTGGRDNSFDLRGFAETAASNTVILVDGVRMQEGDSTTPSTSWVPVEMIDRIEIVHGSAAVEYGQGATAGVVNIITKQGSGQDSGYAYAGVGSFATKDVRAGITTGKDGFSLSTSGYSFHTDNDRANFQNREEGAAVKAQWMGDGTKVGIRLNASTGQQNLPGGLTFAQYVQNPHQANNLFDWGKTDNELAAIYGETQVSGWVLAADLSGREKHTYANYLQSIGDSLSDSTHATQLSLRAKRDQEIYGLSNSLVLGYDLNNWNKSQYINDPGWSAYTGSKSLLESDYAFYLRDTVTLPSTQTSLTAGARSERSNRSVTGLGFGEIQDHLSAWEFGVNQPLGASFSGYAKAAQSYRLPNADEYSCVPAFGCSAFSILQPQKSHDYELGLRWKDQRSALQLRIYRSNLSNEIAYFNDPNALQQGNVNLDPTRRQGVELGGKFFVREDLTLRANLAAREATFRAGQYSGKDVPLVSKFTANVGADWRPGNHQTLGMWANWASTSRAGDDWSNQNQPIPSYWTLNARYALQWKNTEFSVTGNNLANRKYYIYQTYSNPTYQSIYPEAGRSIMAGVRISY